MASAVSRRDFAVKSSVAALGALAAAGSLSSCRPAATAQTSKTEGAIDPSGNPSAAAAVALGARGVNVMDHGAKGDGSTDDTEAVSRAWDEAHDTTGVLVFPAGVFALRAGSEALTKQVRRSMTVLGMGPGSSVLRVQPGTATSEWDRLSQIEIRGEVDAVTLRDLTLDGNARNHPVPPDPFAWEHAHLFLVTSSDSARLRLLHVENVVVQDPTADGISIATDRIDLMRVYACSAVDRTRTRSDIQLSRLPRRTEVRGFTGTAVEVESLSRNDQEERVLVLTDSHVQRLDLIMEAGEQNPEVRNKVHIHNTRVDAQFDVAFADLKMSGCEIGVQYINVGHFRGTRAGSLVTDTSFRLHYDPDENRVDPVFLRHDSYDSEITFRGCRFVVDSEGTHPGPITKGAALSGFPKSEEPGGYRHIVQDCWFDPKVPRSVDATDSGEWVLRNNHYGGEVEAIRVEATKSFRTAVDIDGGDWTQVEANAINALVSEPSRWRLSLRGRHIGYAPIVVSGDPAVVTSTRTVEASISEVPGGQPGSGFAGDEFIVGRPGQTAEHWRCTVTNETFEFASWR